MEQQVRKQPPLGEALGVNRGLISAKTYLQIVLAVSVARVQR